MNYGSSLVSGLNHQFSRFLLVGGLATAVQYVILAVLVEFVATPAPLASSIGFAVSAILNYSLNYRFTFSSKERHRDAIVRFSVVAGLGLLLNYALMFVLVSILDFHYLLAQVQATVVVTLWNYFVNKVWTFKG